MSIADHFEHTPDTAFVRRFDATSARRQFHLSLVLMIVLAASAFLLGALIRFDDEGTATAGQTVSPAPLSNPAPVSTPAPKRQSSLASDFA